MAEKNIKTRIQNKHDIEANWIRAAGFTPYIGELIIYDAETQETFDTAYTKLNDAQKEVLGRTTPVNYTRVKIGDGKRTVNELDFIGTLAGTTDPNANTKSQYYFKYSL